MLIDNPELERLVDEVAELTGESRAEVVRRALEERRERLASRAERPAVTANRDRLSPEEIAQRLAALDELQQSLALTPEQADAWIAEIRAERMAHRIPGDVDAPDAMA